jgi:glycine oxidase
MHTHDYIIIGQGLSGTAIAQQLSSQKKSFIIFDALDPNQASRIASGIWNPVTLKRMKLSWLAIEMLPLIQPFYRDAENLFNANFIEPLKVNRLFAAPEETNDWIEKSDQPIFDELINARIQQNKNKYITSKYGFGEVAVSGRIVTETWLDAARNYFKENKIILEETFDFELLKTSAEGVAYKNINAKGIIFCEGMHAAFKNPYFKYIPYSVTKGEVLEIKCPDLNLDKIINSGVFILPLGDDLYKIGATYDWDNHDFKPTETAREELTSKLEKFMTAPYDIVSQSVGVRPTIRDRRPLLGTHPEIPSVHIFNGMGSRGVYMAPYLSEMFTNFLLDGKPMHKEADIARFNKLYSA